MGRAQQSRQAITIRFNDSDAALVDWLGQFAGNHTMTKVVKLACYMLSGIEPEESLLALLPQAQPEHVSPAKPIRRATTNENNRDAMAAVMQELYALREEISQQRTFGTVPEPARPAPTSPDVTRSASSADEWVPEREYWPPDTHDEEAVVAASGLDMSRRRRRGSSPRRATSPPPAPTPRYDAAESSRILVQTIRNFGKNRQQERS